MRLTERVHAYHRFWRFRLRAERPELGFLLSQDLAGSTLLDVGANRGAYSYWMHRAAGRDGRVVAFEPQPELVEYLRKMKRAFRLSRLTVVGSALSEQPGTMPLVRPRRHWGAASFHLAAEQPDCDVLRVPVTTLDDFLAGCELPAIRFIKCDVQDHEEQVLRGGQRLLATHRPTLLLEQTDASFREGGLGRLLAELGYDGWFFYKQSLAPVGEWSTLRERIRAPFLNYVYRHRDAPTTEQRRRSLRRRAAAC